MNSADMGWEKPSGDTGRIYESRFLGEYQVDKDFVEAEAALPRNERGRYRNDEDLYRLIKEHYSGDPTDPEALHASELRNAVVDALGLAPDDWDRVRVYTAVGTPLDTKLGVDGFIEFDDPQTEKTERVTVDVTLRKSKVSGEERAKADVIIGELPDAVQEEDDYLEEVDRYGHLIASRLMRGSGREKAA